MKIKGSRISKSLFKKDKVGEQISRLIKSYMTIWYSSRTDKDFGGTE